MESKSSIQKNKIPDEFESNLAKLIDSVFEVRRYQVVAKVVLALLGQPRNFDARWERMTKAYDTWREKYGENVTPFLRRKMFVQLLYRHFPALKRRATDKLAEVIYPDVLQIGSTLNFPIANQKQVPCTIVRREITQRGGFLLTFKTPDGTHFSHEYLGD